MEEARYLLSVLLSSLSWSAEGYAAPSAPCASSFPRTKPHRSAALADLPLHPLLAHDRCGSLCAVRQPDVLAVGGGVHANAELHGCGQQCHGLGG